MQRLMLIITALLLMSVCALGQDYRGDEAAYVRSMMSEAGAKSVTQSKAGIRTTESPLKVYVIFSGQERMKANFAARLDEWNRAEGDRYGRVELVDDASHADIILSRFVGGLKSARQDDSRRDNSPTSDLLIDPVSHRAIPLAKAPPHEYSSAQAYCYVAARDGDSLTVLWRGKDTIRAGAGREDHYWERRGSGDSKSAGDRVLKKLFEMSRARTRSKD
jgi:hypothetical protein